MWSDLAILERADEFTEDRFVRDCNGCNDDDAGALTAFAMSSVARLTKALPLRS